MGAPSGYEWTFGAPSRSAEGTWRAAGLAPGAVFGGYRIDALLGRGAMGAVFRATDLTLQRPVALKLLQGTRDATRLRRFQREGELCASLDHPGIVRVHAGGLSSDQQPFLVMELVDGARELGEVLGRLERGAGIALLIDVARAVGYAHRRGVVHRDLKPGNILVDARGHPHVCDFGLAWHDEAERLTRSGAMLGTPSWMAPEQLGLAGRREPSPSCDVWSLGVILYQLLTGQLPFPQSRLLELTAAIAGADPTPPQQVVPGVPAPLGAVCLRALAKDPQARYPDGDALAEALEAALAARPRAALRPGPLALLIGVCILTAVALLRPAPPSRAPTEPGPSPAVTGSPAAAPAPDAPDASLLLDQARALPTEERLRALDDWLARFPADPRRGSAEQLRRETPLASWSFSLDEAGDGYKGRLVHWVDDSRLVMASLGRPLLFDCLLGPTRPVRRALAEAWRPQAFLPGADGLVAASVAGRSLGFFDLAGGELRQVGLPVSSPVMDVVVEPQGRWLISGHADGQLVLVPLSPPGEARVLYRAGMPVESLTVTGGVLLALIGGRSAEQMLSKTPYELLALAVPDGGILDRLLLHRHAHATRLLPGSAGAVVGLSDGQAALVAWDGQRLGTTRFLEAASLQGRARATEEGFLVAGEAHRDDVQSLAWTGRHLLTGAAGPRNGGNHEVRAWDVTSGEERWSLPLEGGVCALVPRGDRLALCWKDREAVHLEVRPLE